MALADSGDIQRLRRGQDIRAVFSAGVRGHGGTAVVHTRSRGDRRPARVAVVAGRRIGRAVDRNRAKRRLRAALAQLEVPPGIDVVVVARPGAVDAPYPAVRNGVARALAQALAGQD